LFKKILVTVPEKFEATISSIENSKDVSSITLAELLNALQAQEQRRLMRQAGSVEGAFFFKITEQYATKKQKLQQQQHNISIVFLLQKIQPSTEQMLVEAGYKMSQMWTARTHWKGMQISTTTAAARRSQNCC
jgi:hypothetical protein